MHHRSSRLNQSATARFGAACALCLLLLPPVGAEPVVLHDGTQPTEATADTSKLVTMEPAPPPLDETMGWPTTPSTDGKKQEPDPTPERAPLPAQVRLERPGAAPALPPDRADANADPSIHSVIKEGVRPVYEQLVESGAVDTWHELKADLGLNKDQWSEQQKSNASGKGPGQWDAPAAQDPAPPPITAAQAQLDREMATLMREKLIDQITPWVIGLVVLYVVGYLAKVLYGFVRWKAGKRNERRLARAKRHAARRSHSTPRAASGTPHAARVNPESQESV